MLFATFSTCWNIPLNTETTPFQACDQLPVKTPVMKSIIPPNTVIKLLIVPVIKSTATITKFLAVSKALANGTAIKLTMTSTAPIIIFLTNSKAVEMPVTNIFCKNARTFITVVDTEV